MVFYTRIIHHFVLCLTGSHTFGDSSLQSQFSLSVVVTGGLLDLQSLHSVRQSGFNLVSGVLLQLSRQDWVGDGGFDRCNVSLQLLLLFVSLGESVVSVLELLSVSNHLLNLVGGQSTDRVRDGDVSRSAGRLLDGSDLQDTVSVNLEDSLQDWLTSGHWWDVLQVELTQQGVLRTVDTLTSVDWELNGGLVVSNSGESSSLDGWNSAVSWDNWSENVTLHGDTQRQWDDIQQQQVLGVLRGGLTGQDSTLDSGTVSNSLIWVDGLLQLLTVEEVRQQLSDLWNSGGTTNQDNFVNTGLGDLSILQDLLNWVQGRLEQSRVNVLESSSGDVSGEVFTLEQRVNFNGGLGDRRQSSLSTLTGSSQSSQSSGVTRDVQTGLLLEVSLEEVQQVGVEILTTQVSVTSGSLDGENTTSDVQQRNIESTSTQVEDQNVSLLLGLTSTQTVSNSGGSWLVDDSQDVQTSNGTSVLGGLTLSVVKVSWNSDNSLLHLLTNLGLSNLLHLGQNHRGNFLRGESLGLLQVLNFNQWVTVGVDDLERPGLDVLLDRLVVESTTNQTLSIENSVLWVQSSSVLSSVTNQSFLSGESNEGRSNSVTSFVSNDFDSRVVSSNTRVGSTQIDTDSTSENTVSHY
ncbi:heat shock protein SSB1 [Clavispora lusitaniae ATCC 42720]|uniref:Heat shock protein SSB1 n=1 Tax=Clavispora lusitaniae (strain ATCC 42720) TaxID=306902 RepID=C4Y2Q7_CLAL4|nr:heat shock protein SSB1 [Clavispora lusitaniae ATCC 42720]EEQ38695.1 heat shock protein SSB1 [Clavispora lusitaniae ATCC 42720]